MKRSDEEAASRLGSVFSFVAAIVVAAGLPASAMAENRTIDGAGNNIANPNWGASNAQLLRFSPNAYGDSVWTPARGGNASPRVISNAVNAQTGSIVNDRNMSDWVWQWGQFIDHDFSLTEPGAVVEPFNIQVPAGDPHFDPFNTGTQVIPFNRAEFIPGTGIDPSNPREHANQLTSFIDGSMVYGSNNTRAAWLRDPLGGGRLKVTADANGDLMPFNDGTVPNAMGMSTSHYVAGDVRANEQLGLTAVHTLFVREHNRLADQIGAANPGWTDDEIYERARKVVGAEIQAITYNEFLPALFGPGALGAYAGYDPNIDASIATEFSTAAYRIGHTLLSSTLRRVDNDGNTIPDGDITLAQSFFNPGLIASQGGIDPLLKGLASQGAQEFDAKLIDDVRNFLFGPPGAGGLDLASLNIQRSRDLGVADFNTIRQDYGLPAVLSFSDISSDPAVQAALASVYNTVDDIDPWVGMLAEDHFGLGSVGETMRAVILDQFERVRDGDRFFYLSDPELSGELAFLNGLTLGDIIRLNTGITNLQSNVFFIPAPGAAALLLAAGLTATRRRRNPAAA